MKETEAKKKIIEYFRKHDGLFVSGEDVSAALGFSRAGAWKYISKLRDDGYMVEAVPHLGYRLKSSPDKLYGHEIAVGLKTKVIGKGNIHHYETIASTNDKAYELAEAGELEGAFVAAETQTQGKGRMGRKWSSPAGGVYVSLILKPNVETDEIPTITLVAALAVVRAIKTACALDAKIKWPNDVFIGGNKVCGILTEIKAQPDRVDFLVLGMGINVNTAPGKMPPGGTSLKIECGKNLSRSGFLRCVLEEFEKDYNVFKKKGFLALRDECRSSSVLIGRKVTVTEHNRKYGGVAEDIDEKGRLVLNVGGRKICRVFSGDVTLCR